MQPAELLRQLQGRVQLLAQQRLSRAAGRTVCQRGKEHRPDDRNVKGELNRDEDQLAARVTQPGPEAELLRMPSFHQASAVSPRQSRELALSVTQHLLSSPKVLLSEMVSAEANCLGDITDSLWVQALSPWRRARRGIAPHLKHSLGTPCAQTKRSSHCPVPSGIISRNGGCYL